MATDKTDAEVWAATAQNVVVMVILGAGWLTGRVEALVAIPALLACAGIDLRNRVKRGKAPTAGPMLVMAASLAAQQLI